MPILTAGGVKLAGPIDVIEVFKRRQALGLGRRGAANIASALRDSW
jgi:hypothetical protein